MRLVGLDVIEKAQKRYSSVAKPSSTLLDADGSKVTVSSSLQDVRNSYPSADKVGERYVFDIGGNRFRLIAKINFPAGIVAVRWFGTHAEYDKLGVEEV